MLLARYCDLLLAGVFGNHVARRRFRRRKAQEPEIHFDHEKRVARFSISTHACGSLPIVMVFPLETLPAAGDQTVLHPKSCSSRRLRRPVRQHYVHTRLNSHVVLIRRSRKYFKKGSQGRAFIRNVAQLERRHKTDSSLKPI